MSNRENPLWRGIRAVPLLLALGAIVLSLVLIITGKLPLYVNPRYTVFTAVMAALALTLIFISANKPVTSQHTHPVPKSQTVLQSVAALLLVPLVLLPHTPLSAERAGATIATTQPTITAAAPESSAVAAAQQSQDFNAWAQLLAAGSTANDLAGNTVHATGFITATDSPDVLLLSRYSVTCCIVDAQPITIPVYFPGWQQNQQPGQWLEITGFFIANPDPSGAHRTLLSVQHSTPLAPPANPYLDGTGGG